MPPLPPKSLEGPMTRDDWLEIATRLPVGEIPELDGTGTRVRERSPVETASSAGAHPPSGGLSDDASQTAAGWLDPTMPPPTSLLWPLADEPAARFGVRVRRAPDDIRSIAARLIAAAVERGTCPIILSHVHRSGFEHLGFRVERIHAAGKDEELVQERELTALWHLVMIVDIEEVGTLW
jgi:hypothetical protein